MQARFLTALFAALIVPLAFPAPADAQQIYRWTDDKGRVHITDTPPPANARDMQVRNLGSSSAAPTQMPFELAQAVKDFPVVLYTSPNCKDPCAMARAALNKRGIPFKEVQVWEQESNTELKRISGSDEVPTLLVGKSVHKGFQQTAYDALLDSARYPRAGILPARSQPAPEKPEGYVPPGERPAAKAASPAEPEPEAPRGPYSPEGPSQGGAQEK
jgi:glutaredoxin